MGMAPGPVVIKVVFLKCKLYLFLFVIYCSDLLLNSNYFKFSSSKQQQKTFLVFCVFARKHDI